jgi:hypothetical protein
MGLNSRLYNGTKNTEQKASNFSRQNKGKTQTDKQKPCAMTRYKSVRTVQVDTNYLRPRGYSVQADGGHLPE